MHIEDGSSLRLKDLNFLERVGAEMEVDGDRKKVRIWLKGKE